MADPITTAGNPADKHEHKTLMEALLAVQAEADTLKLGKDQEGQVGNQKTKYLSLDKLTDATRPLLVNHGLVWQTFPTTLDGEPALRYRLTHVASGEQQEDVMRLMLDKNNSQGQGSALTYSRRQARQAVLDVVADDDDDGKAAGGDERMMLSRRLTAKEREALAKMVTDAGLDIAEVLATVDAGTLDEVTLAQAVQIRGIVNLKGGD